MPEIAYIEPMLRCSIKPHDERLHREQERVRAMATKTKKATPSESTGVGKAATAAMEQAEEAAGAIFAGYEDLTLLGKENFGALVRANSALTHGLEAIGQEMIGYTRGSL